MAAGMDRVRKRKEKHGGQFFALCFCLFWAVVLPAAGGAAQSESAAWLSSHNRYRSRHHSAPLQWSAMIADSARAYAATCPKGHSASAYGENISWATYGQSPQSVVDYWYSEEPGYDYERPGFSPGIGHFTQIVWKNSTEVGCGCRFDCPDGYSNVCVCQYNPSGNYRNRFSENVLPSHAK